MFFPDRPPRLRAIRPHPHCMGQQRVGATKSGREKSRGGATDPSAEVTFSSRTVASPHRVGSRRRAKSVWTPRSLFPGADIIENARAEKSSDGTVGKGSGPHPFALPRSRTQEKAALSVPSTRGERCAFRTSFPSSSLVLPRGVRPIKGSGDLPRAFVVRCASDRMPRSDGQT